MKYEVFQLVALNVLLKDVCNISDNKFAVQISDISG